jgi:predicted RND superfamily exporter protein
LSRQKLGKTATIKERSLYVYLPSQEMVSSWKDMAEKAGLSISKFIVDRVEDSVRAEESKGGYASRIELLQKMSDMEEELKNLRKENSMLKVVADNFDKELKKYRAMPFLEEKFQGVREFDRQLIDLLKKGGIYRDDYILSSLNIRSNDVELIKAVDRQLQILESYGLLEYTANGWRWKG